MMDLAVPGTWMRGCVKVHAGRPGTFYERVFCKETPPPNGTQFISINSSHCIHPEVPTSILS